LSRVPDIAREEVNFIAAEFLHARAADGGLALCEQFDAAPVDEREFGFCHFLDERVQFRAIICEDAAEVRVHAFALIKRTGEDTDFDAGLEDEIKRGRERAQKGLSTAAVCPHDAVGGH
jgi:hypothetical protein